MSAYTAKLLALHAAAWPGPWSSETSVRSGAYRTIYAGDRAVVARDVTPNEAAFIAAAYDGVPVLCREVEELRAEWAVAVDIAKSIERYVKQQLARIEYLESALQRQGQYAAVRNDLVAMTAAIDALAESNEVGT